MLDKIYIFENGTKIDLSQIICIGAIEKTNADIIVMPVFCKGFNRPIEITLGHSVGKVDLGIKLKIETVYNDFNNAWMNFINEK